MKALASLTALIIEPHAGMRTSLHNMLNQCGITKIDYALSSGAAIRPLRNKFFDVILCEYDLGAGQDGQQLLEDLRQNKLIPLWTVYMMVTAERSYEKVVGAAEFVPTDYILKPFTADTLLERIDRAIKRREIFLPTFHLMEQGSLHEAVASCIEGEANHPRYATDFMRLRAELHVTLGEGALAEPIYQKLLGAKAVAWARLGLAKTLFMQQRFDEAEVILTKLVADNKRFMSAYDWLAKTQEASGKLEDAKTMLESAVAISPHAVWRLRKLGEVALETGDLDTAERSFQKVVTKAKYSEFRDPEDHVRLVKALVTKGNTQQAANVIRDLEKSLAGEAKMPACRAFSAAMLHQSTGDFTLATEELTIAVGECRDVTGLSGDMKMALAKICLENDLEEGAAEIMLEVMSNSKDNEAMVKAMSVFEQAGRTDLAESVSKESKRQVVDMVSAGAEKAKQGDFRGAVALMTKAAHKLPDNPQVVFNAAVAVLKCLENLGWDSRLGEQARGYIANARRLDATNPRLAALSDLYRTILKKYEISAG